jgi:hypothetical protein
MQIYVQKNSEQTGPFEEAQIRAGIDSGEFKTDDLAWTTGKASWQPLSTLLTLDTSNPPPIEPAMSESHAIAALSAKNIISADAHPSTRKSPTKKRVKPWEAVLWTCVASACAISLLWAHSLSSTPYSEPTREWWKDYRNGAEKGESEPSTERLNLQDAMRRQNIQPLERTIPRSSTHAQDIDLRGTMDKYKQRFGQPGTTDFGITKPAGIEMSFVDGRLVYLVAFWNLAAHHINVFRADYEALTDDDVGTGLKVFSGGKKWNEVPALVDSISKRYEREGVTAWLVKTNVTGTPKTVLRIATPEFVQEYNKHQQNEGR